MPEYGGAVRESDSHSTESSGNPFPSVNQQRWHSTDGKPSNGGAGEQWRDGSNRDKASTGSGRPNNGMPTMANSQSNSPTRPLTPSTRADSARAAARDAQLSAERALAAAATASRAADLAARAAMEV